MLHTTVMCRDCEKQQQRIKIELFHMLISQPSTHECMFHRRYKLQLLCKYNIIITVSTVLMKHPTTNPYSVHTPFF